MKHKVLLFFAAISLILFIKGPCGDPAVFTNKLEIVSFQITNEGLIVYTRGYVPMSIYQIEVIDIETKSIIYTKEFSNKNSYNQTLVLDVNLKTNIYYKFIIKIRNDNSSKHGFRTKVPGTMVNTIELIILNQFERNKIYKINYSLCDSIVGCPVFKIYQSNIESDINK